MDHVTGWMKANSPDILLLQELKSPTFPAEIFQEMGYVCEFVAQKAYNGVAILSRYPIQTVCKSLRGDDSDEHARFLEAMIEGIRVVDVYMPNGNPIGSEKFLYKLGWMDRVMHEMMEWRKGEVPTMIGGDFNVIPEDIDCHKPASWMRDALFQPEPRERYRAMLRMGYVDAFRSLHPGETGQFTFWDYFRQAFDHNRGIRIDHFLLSPSLAGRLKSCTIDRGPRQMEKPSDHTPIVMELS